MSSTDWRKVVTYDQWGNIQLEGSTPNSATNTVASSYFVVDKMNNIAMMTIMGWLP